MGLTLMVIGAIVLVYAWGVARPASTSTARTWLLYALALLVPVGAAIAHDRLLGRFPLPPLIAAFVVAAGIPMLGATVLAARLARRATPSDDRQLYALLLSAFLLFASLAAAGVILFRAAPEAMSDAF